MNGLFNVKSSFLLFFLFASCLVVPSFADGRVNDFPLNADGSVVANYNNAEKVLMITGSGDIEYDRWVALAKRFHYRNYTFSKIGWIQWEKFNIKFNSEDNKKIYLCSTGKGAGLFSGFKGNIFFNNSVDTSKVTDMSNMFFRAINFNSDISDWDTSNVTNMEKMFDYAFHFNSDISSWDTSNVTNMRLMFSHAENFNCDISEWDVSSVTNMEYMFNYALSFNADISQWNVSKVSNMHAMFNYIKNFNFNVSDWNVSSVTNMEGIFSGIITQNLDLSKWDISNVDNFIDAFSKSTISRINLLNREDVLDGCYVTDVFSDLDAEFIGFTKFPEFTWEELPHDYWVSEDDGEFIKENTKDNDKTFAEGKKYVLETQITSYPEVSNFERVYNGNVVSMDDIAHSCKDFVDYDIAGTWDLDLHGHNGIDVGSYTATVSFTPDDTDKYRTPESIDININITKAIPNVTVPSELRGWKNQSLAEVRIPVVDGGVWTFDDESAILSRTGKHRYNITFTPSSPNFKVINTSVEIEVLEYTEEKPLVDKKEKGEEESTEDILEEEKTTPESSSNSLPFDDVEKSDWYHDSVKNVYQDKMLKGISENKFSPKLKVTRGMMITSIYNMNGKEDVVERSVFNDIAKDSYYEKAVNWGQKNSIVKGYGKDFRPDKPILRQEMVAMLYRYRNCDCYDKVAGDAKLIQEFRDASKVSAYARDAMDWALSTGLIIGRSEDVLAPREVLTRAELATILERFSRLAK